MEKIILILSIQILATTFLFGQGINESHFSKKNALKLSPSELGESEFQISYERYLGEDRSSSFLIIPSIYLKETREETKSGWQVMGQYRFYLTHLRKDRQKTFLKLYNSGFYTGLYGLYLDYEENYMRGVHNPNDGNYYVEQFDKSIKALEGGALLGIQIDITQRILIDFYVGGGIRSAETKDTYFDEPRENDYYESYHIFDLEYTGVKPRLGFSVGFTF